ncbi:SRPBCC family protein [Pseudoalteromonas sp. SWYJ118]|uniref:SRPBCC family protein n=1 Tax=Pseudoalteromonas sp. SWYJ118 TaxID=2792062 RepID=UPI0018CD358A|nr:SRPBCC family protein [Pseudoalteromonas sp. SWYJ118]MBH0075568.1 SRPBCC family protein [Pseudoalteromonas sp. SWYJ118]
MILITIKQTLNAQPKQIISTLLDHQQLHRFFNAKFTLLQAQDEGQIEGGKGSVRQVKIGKITFSEQIISADQNLISYQIVGDKPVANHRGDIYLTANKDINTLVTELNYCISCSAPWWMPNALLKYVITKDITQALNNLNNYFLAGKA